MLKMNIRSFFLLVLLSNFLYSYDVIVGSGNIIQKKLFLEKPILIIESNVIADIDIMKSDKEYALLSGDDNIISNFKLEYSEGRLRLSSKISYQTKSRIVLKLYVKKIQMINSTSLSNIYLSNLKQKSLTINLNGVNDISSSQTQIGELKVIANGSYNLELNETKTNNIYLELEGSGDIEINAKDNIYVKSNASVNIDYIGDAKLYKDINITTTIEKIK